MIYLKEIVTAEEKLSPLAFSRRCRFSEFPSLAYGIWGCLTSISVDFFKDHHYFNDFF
jgi:hypothetical protein